MTKKDIIEVMSKDTGMSKTACEAALSSALESIKDSLRKKNPVKIRGFGTFDVKKFKARITKTPTGNSVSIPVTYRVRFYPSEDITTI